MTWGHKAADPEFFRIAGLPKEQILPWIFVNGGLFLFYRTTTTKREKIMLRTVTKKMVVSHAQALICLMALAVPCYGGVIFEDNFDSKPDWNMDGSKVECNSGTCSGAPENWSYYRQTNGFGQITGRIFNQADHTTGSGKAYVIYSESDPNINWPSESELSKVFSQDYPEIYYRVWMKTQAGWQSATSSQQKVARMAHYDRIGNVYENFSTGNMAPFFFLQWGTSSYHGADYLPSFRCDPQSSNYYCPQYPYDNDYFTKFSDTIQPPTAQGLYGDGQWHRYDFHMKMNTQTGTSWNKDGSAEFWYDGVLKMSHNDVQWKYPGSDVAHGWNYVSIGGNASNTFASQGEQWYAVDDVVESTTPIPADYVIGGGSSAADTTSPTVAISSPVASATVSGTVSVTATASDNVGVTKVEYYVNNVLKATDTSTPYVYSWDTSALAAGTYALTAKAYDAAGNVAQAGSVSVSVVKDTVAPAVSLTSPANNAVVSGSVAITASAADNVGVSKVEYYGNGVLLTASNVAPYSYNWNTGSAANGTYVLTAKAYDASGNVGQSTSVTVTVTNAAADTTAPVASIVSPAANATVSGTVRIAATATDTTGVSKVEFYVNGALKATDSISPYSYSWNTTSVANGVHTITVKAYDASNNVGQSAAVTVTVNNRVVDTIAPAITIISPAANSTVSGLVNVTVSASDNVGVSKVEYYVNGGLDYTGRTAPYGYSVATTVAHNGTYTMYAKAYDAAGNVKQTPTISFTIKNR